MSGGVRGRRRKPPPTQSRAISELPNGSDIKRLQGYNNLYRLRVGNIRVLYSIQESLMIISIENIDNRGDVYKRY